MAKRSNPANRRELTVSDAYELVRTIFAYIARIANERDLDRLLVMLADMGRDLIGADRCTVWLLDRKQDVLWSRVAHGMGRVTIPRSAGIAGNVADTGEPVITNEPYQDTRFDKEVDRRTGYLTKNILALPIRDSEGTVIGVYQAINKKTSPGIFTDYDVEHLLLAASYTGKHLEAAMLQEEIEATQKEIIFTLAETGEMRSKETGYHVKRVAEYSYVFALKFGLSAEESELLRLASPLHDIGKIAIPDSVLLKPGKLDAEEWTVMKSHAALGYDMLKHSERRILKAAAVVAHEHHEKWDGSGYPRAIAGADIHIYGRITALADVFDALGSDRVYKRAWEMDRIVELFRNEGGGHFDPDLVQVFLDNLEAFLEIRERYRDEPGATQPERA